MLRLSSTARPVSVTVNVPALAAPSDNDEVPAPKMTVPVSAASEPAARTTVVTSELMVAVVKVAAKASDPRTVSIPVTLLAKSVQ